MEDNATSETYDAACNVILGAIDLVAGNATWWTLVTQSALEFKLLRLFRT